MSLLGDVLRAPFLERKALVTITVRTGTGLVGRNDNTNVDGFSLPAAVAADDLLLAFCGIKQYDVDISGGTFISNYTLLDNHTNGSVANGASLGSVRLHIRSRVHSGSEVAPVGVASTIPDPAMACMSGFAKTTPGAWDIVTAPADDVSATGTAVNCTPGATMDIKAGDVLIVAIGIKTNVSLSSSAMSVPGCTISGLTNNNPTAGFASTNRGGMRVVSVTVLTGTASGPPSFTATHGTSGASDVVATFIRLREPVAGGGGGQVAGGSIADERRRVMVAYCLTNGVANAASLSINDLTRIYHAKLTGNEAAQAAKSTTEIIRSVIGATPGVSTSSAKRTHRSATNSESLADAEKRYWGAL